MTESNKNKGFFSRIKRMLSGAMTDGECVTEADDIIECVGKTLSHTIDDKDITKGKILIVWLDVDRILFDRYNTDSYKLQLLSNLWNERGYLFEDASFCIGVPDARLRATKIAGITGGFMQIVSNEFEAQHIHRKAQICVVGSFGSIVDDGYIISVDDMKMRNLNVYNIGAGRFPLVRSGFRENHIAIDDNPDSPMIELNKYVSRTHAHIGFSERYGFYLQVEIDGTRIMGKRTRIFRGKDVIECDNPNVKNFLKDSDIIELGKAVKLQYFELD